MPAMGPELAGHVQGRCPLRSVGSPILHSLLLRCCGVNPNLLLERHVLHTQFQERGTGRDLGNPGDSLQSLRLWVLVGWSAAETQDRVGFRVPQACLHSPPAVLVLHSDPL